MVRITQYLVDIICIHSRWIYKYPPLLNFELKTIYCLHCRIATRLTAIDCYLFHFCKLPGWWIEIFGGDFNRPRTSQNATCIHIIMSSISFSWPIFTWHVIIINLKIHNHISFVILSPFVHLHIYPSFQTATF